MEDINVIDNWGKNMSNNPKIPSVYSYTLPQHGEEQWGESLSHDAMTMINTKLELEVQDNKSGELELILQALEGMGNLRFEHVKAARGCPEYTWKSPEEIVTDYLIKVFQCVDREVEKFSPLLKARIPVDIVITVPVVSVEAFNLCANSLLIFALAMVLSGEELDAPSRQSGRV